MGRELVRELDNPADEPGGRTAGTLDDVVDDTEGGPGGRERFMLGLDALMRQFYYRINFAPTRVSMFASLLRKLLCLAFALSPLLAICPCALAAATEGQPAPAMQAKLLDGATFKLGDNAGKVVIVNLWATWCAPCRAEMPALDAYYRAHRDDGLVMLAISMDDPKDETKVREAMKPFAFPAALARDADIKAYGRVWRLPLTFVIDRQGVLRKEDWYGDPGIDASSLEQVVTPLLRAH